MKNLHIEAKSSNAFEENGEAQVIHIRGAAAAEVEEADKGDDVVVDKDDGKQAKPKPK